MEKCGSPCHCIIEPLPIIEKAAEKLRIFSSLFFGSDTATPPPKKKRVEENARVGALFLPREPSGAPFPYLPPPPSWLLSLARGLACVPRCEGKGVARKTLEKEIATP